MMNTLTSPHFHPKAALFFPWDSLHMQKKWDASYQKQLLQICNQIINILNLEASIGTWPVDILQTLVLCLRNCTAHAKLWSALRSDRNFVTLLHSLQSALTSKTEHFEHGIFVPQLKAPQNIQELSQAIAQQLIFLIQRKQNLNLETKLITGTQILFNTDTAIPLIELKDAHPEKQNYYGQLGAHSIEQWVSALQNAFDCLRQTSPQLMKQINYQIRSIFPYGQHGAKHFSSSFSLLPQHISVSFDENPWFLAEAIIHEFHHCKIYWACCEDAQVQGFEWHYSPQFYSPWRPDPRPLWGILLGMHAFLGMNLFLEKALKSGASFLNSEDKESQLPAMQERLLIYHIKNLFAYVIIERQVKFTEIGFGLWQEMVTEFLRQHQIFKTNFDLSQVLKSQMTHLNEVAQNYSQVISTKDVDDIVGPLNKMI